MILGLSFAVSLVCILTVFLKFCLSLVIPLDYFLWVSHPLSLSDPFTSYLWIKRIKRRNEWEEQKETRPSVFQIIKEKD
jgi:hypothetical protein